MMNKKQLFITVLLSVCTPYALAAGQLVIAGGGLSGPPNPVYDRFVELAGGSGAQICIFGTNSSDPLDSSQFYAGIFNDLGASTKDIPITMQNSAWNTEPFDDGGFTFDEPALELRETPERLANSAELADQLSDCSGFWFGGGNQSRGSFALLNQDGSDTPVAAAMRAAVAAGTVFGGTSAGAALQSDPMIVNGVSADSLSQPPGPLRVGTAPGLGVLPSGLLADQHFLQRGRFGRLLVAMADLGITTGVGVDDDTALVVDLAAGTWEVVGASQALVVELADPESPALATVHLLGHGDVYNVTSNTVSQINPALGDITGDPFLPQAPVFKLGVFNPGIVPDLLTLAVDTRDESVATGIDFVGGDGSDGYVVGGVQVVFSQTDATQAFLCFRSCRADNPNRSGTHARYTVTNMQARINAIGIGVAPYARPIEDRADQLRFINTLRRVTAGSR